MKLTVHIVTLLLFAVNILAAQPRGQQGDFVFNGEYKIYFQMNKDDVVPSHRDNSNTLASLYADLTRLESVDSVCIYAYSSPEGINASNNRLSKERAEALKSYILKNAPKAAGIESQDIKIYGMGENWEQFKLDVTNRYRRHNKQSVLRILGNDNISGDTKKWRLEKLDDGYTWIFLKKFYIPDLKYAKICVYGRNPLPAKELLSESTVTDTLLAVVPGVPASLTPVPVEQKASAEKQEAVEPESMDAELAPVTVSADGSQLDMLSAGAVTKHGGLKRSQTFDSAEKKIAPAEPDTTVAVSAVEPLATLTKDAQLKLERQQKSPKKVVTKSKSQPKVQSDTISVIRIEEVHQIKAEENVKTKAVAEKKEKTKSKVKTDSLKVRDTVLRDQKTVLGLKTNLLLDAATAVNFAVEVPIGKRFSVEYFQTCPWWTSANNKFCLQMLSFGAQAKWYFLPRTKPASENLKVRDALVGHFLGLYGWGGYGDLQFGRKVCQQFEFWSAGLTYGYSLPVSKHLNMEFTLSVGYAYIPYQHYNPTEDFSLLLRDYDFRGTLHYIGPTKAEISLIVPIRANTGKKKGGRK